MYSAEVVGCLTVVVLRIGIYRRIHHIGKEIQGVTYTVSLKEITILVFSLFLRHPREEREALPTNRTCHII